MILDSLWLSNGTEELLRDAGATDGFTFTTEGTIVDGMDGGGGTVATTGLDITTGTTGLLVEEE